MLSILWIWLILLSILRNPRLTYGAKWSRISGSSNAEFRDRQLKMQAEARRNSDQLQKVNDAQSECTNCAKKGRGVLTIKESTSALQNKRRNMIVKSYYARYMIHKGKTEWDSGEYVYIDGPNYFDRMYYYATLPGAPLNQEPTQEENTQSKGILGKLKNVIGKLSFAQYRLSLRDCFAVKMLFGIQNFPNAAIYGKELRKTKQKGIIQMVNELSSIPNRISMVENVDSALKETYIRENLLDRAYFARPDIIAVCEGIRGHSSKCNSRKSQTDSLKWSGMDAAEKEWAVQFKYPIAPKETILLPFYKAYDFPMTSTNIPITAALKYKTMSPLCKRGFTSKELHKQWECETEEDNDCEYLYYRGYSEQKIGKPVWGFLHVDGNWNGFEKCRDPSMRGADETKKGCAFRLKSIWPGDITRLKFWLLNPPKYKLDHVWVDFKTVPPYKFIIDFSNGSPVNKQSPTAAVYQQSLCFASSDPQALTQCEKKYKDGSAPKGYKAAIITGGRMLPAISGLTSYRRSKTVTMKLRNPESTPLSGKMFYKFEATIDQSALWTKWELSGHESLLPAYQRDYWLRAPDPPKLKIDVDFEPEQPLIGQTLKVVLSVENKRNSYRLRAAQRLKERDDTLQSNFQEADIIVIPTGTSASGGSRRVGLEPVNNKVSFRKSIYLLTAQYATFTVREGGKQCVSFQIRGKGAKYYEEKKGKCINIPGALKGEYREKLSVDSISTRTVYNRQDNDDIAIVIRTGRGKLQGSVILQPKVSGILDYQLGITPTQLNTGNCRQNCVLKFSVNPKLQCAFDSDTNIAEKIATIEWTSQYSVDGKSVYLAPPPPLKFRIIDADPDEMDEDDPDYPRIIECLGDEAQSITDSPELPPCPPDTDPDLEGIQHNGTTWEPEIDCTIRELEGFEADNSVPTDDTPVWWKDFWQINWTWQYAVLGSATVCLVADLLKQLDIIGNNTALLEMLESMPLEMDENLAENTNN